MRNYVDGKEYFLKVTAKDSDSVGWPVGFTYNDGIGKSCGRVEDKPGLLLTASEVAATFKDGKLYSELVEDKNAEVALYADEVKKLRSEKDDLQKAVEGLNKEIDGYRAAFLKMASVIGFLCGGEQDG